MNIVMKLKQKGIRFYLCILSSLLAVIGLILYLVTTVGYAGNNADAEGTFAWQGIVFTLIGVALATIAIVWRDPADMFTAFVPMFYVLVIMFLLVTQVQNIAFALYNISDIGHGILPTFILSMIFYVIAICIAIAVAVIGQPKIDLTEQEQKNEGDQNDNNY